jgi:hypothetical protein
MRTADLLNFFISPPFPSCNRVPGKAALVPDEVKSCRFSPMPETAG